MFKELRNRFQEIDYVCMATSTWAAESIHGLLVFELSSQRITLVNLIMDGMNTYDNKKCDKKECQWFDRKHCKKFAGIELVDYQPWVERNGSNWPTFISFRFSVKMYFLLTTSTKNVLILHKRIKFLTFNKAFLYAKVQTFLKCFKT